MSKTETNDWKTHAHDAEEIRQAEKLAELLWHFLRRDPEHKERRTILGGTKTKLGLLRSVKEAIT